MALSKEELWVAMQQPTDKTCQNCRHKSWNQEDQRYGGYVSTLHPRSRCMKCGGQPESKNWKWDKVT